MLTDQTMHKVKGIEIRRKRARSKELGEYYTLNIVFTDSDGESMTIAAWSTTRCQIPITGDIGVLDESSGDDSGAQARARLTETFNNPSAGAIYECG